MKSKLRKYKTVRGLLASKLRWTQLRSARTKENVGVPLRSVNAAKFCLLGACYRVYGNGAQEVIEKLRGILDVRGYYHGVSIFNDTGSHAEVLALVREAKV
jgi:hypothetical protein